jgi:hypothetical protein
MNNTWEKKILARIKTRLGIETSNTKNDDLLKDYIKSSFDEIIVHTQSNSYDLSYDNKLIQCVVFLYNKRGLEGVVSRSANGISDDFNIALEIAPILATMPIRIKPNGYKYSNNRFDYPII